MADHIKILELVLATLPDHADGKPWGTRLLIRCNSAGGTKGLINHIHQLGHQYLMGFTTTQAFSTIAAVTALGDDVRSSTHRPNGQPAPLDEGYVVDVTGLVDTYPTKGHRADTIPRLGITISDYPDDLRLVMKAAYAAAGAQLRLTDDNGRRIRLVATNLFGHPQRIDRLSSVRGRREQRIKNMKDLGLSKLPHTSFAMNQAWILACQLASSLITWTGFGHIADIRRAHRDHARVLWWCWEPKTIRARIITIAGIVVTHARQTLLRLDGAAFYHQVAYSLLRRKAPG